MTLIAQCRYMYMKTNKNDLTQNTEFIVRKKKPLFISRILC